MTKHSCSELRHFPCSFCFPVRQIFEKIRCNAFASSHNSRASACSSGTARAIIRRKCFVSRDSFLQVPMHFNNSFSLTRVGKLDQSDDLRPFRPKRQASASSEQRANAEPNAASRNGSGWVISPRTIESPRPAAARTPSRVSSMPIAGTSCSRQHSRNRPRPAPRSRTRGAGCIRTSRGSKYRQSRPSYRP